MSSRRGRVGGGNTFRSEAATPVSRIYTPPASLLQQQPPSSQSRAVKTGRRAPSNAAISKPSGRTSGGTAVAPPRSCRTGRSEPVLTPYVDHLSGRRSTGRRSAGSSIPDLEARVNREVGNIFLQVDGDVGFNKDDEQESYEARKIVENQKADKKGTIEKQHQIRDIDLDGDGQIDENEKFVNQISELALVREDSHITEADPVLDGTWEKNQNAAIKWWQGLPQTVTKQEAEDRGLLDLSPAHPAYFQMRRQMPGMDYVDKPAFKTRTELLESRKRCNVPDSTYDLDGDGVVGQREYFMAARLDKDVSGSLSLEEKREGLANMRKDMAAVMFVDNAGIRGDKNKLNQYRILQQDGKVVLDQR